MSLAPRPGLAWRSCSAATVDSARLGLGWGLTAGSAPFAVVPRRWVVERTFAWRGRCRRLSKDYEYLRVRSEDAVCLAMAVLLVRRLAGSAY
ncbi:transposase [Streptomyces hirsutus]|uniref:transposase n=1 Tax=Streptomyces hirsutus TaxID=35620 RepID=UPI0038998E71